MEIIFLRVGKNRTPIFLLNTYALYLNKNTYFAENAEILTFSM